MLDDEELEIELDRLQKQIAKEKKAVADAKAQKMDAEQKYMEAQAKVREVEKGRDADKKKLETLERNRKSIQFDADTVAKAAAADRPIPSEKKEVQTDPVSSWPEMEQMEVEMAKISKEALGRTSLE